MLKQLLGIKANIPEIILKTGEVIDKLTTSKEEKLQLELELRKAELEFDSKIFEQEVKDRDSARQMQIEALKQDDRFIKRFSAYLTIFSLLFSFIYITLITFVSLSPASQRIADTVLGLIIGLIIGSIYNYWFGSSYGSLRKTDLLKNQER